MFRVIQNVCHTMSPKENFKPYGNKPEALKEIRQVLRS